MIVLGLHKNPWHDTGACIISDKSGSFEVCSISEERLNREKDSRVFPERAIKACMEKLDIKSYAEIDFVVMDYIEDKDWRKDNIEHKERIHEILKEFPEDKIIVINHHLAHASATYFSSPFNSASVLVIDGRGSNKETQSIFIAKDNQIKPLESTSKMGIGLLYSTVTRKIGFKVLEEGKVMGLAPYGKEYNRKIFNFPERFSGIETDFEDVMVLGKYELTKEYDKNIETLEDKKVAAFEIQDLCEKVFLHLANYAKKITNEDYLCLSGGSSLNSVSNYKVLKSGFFKDVFINPAASDTGIPLGCALYGYHVLGNKPKTYKEISPYLGPEYTINDIKKAIKEFSGYKIVRKDAKPEAVKMLLENKIISIFWGRSETGPRALGNRSIVMSPMIAENKDVLNARVKHRESFRPFAPAILVEHLQEYFDIPRPEPYMLTVPMVKEDKKKLIPAATHYDGTGRVQSVSKELNKNFYELIELFYKKTKVPVLINTSFNVAGEPIVESPKDAIKCFLGTDIDALLFENILLIKNKLAN
ncbi:MAG: carbamoyltransferase C-terminal domain-containing protein [Candidatus Paceibacterota bacterium]|jgi:carbamoyltransferase